MAPGNVGSVVLFSLILISSLMEHASPHPNRVTDIHTQNEKDANDQTENEDEEDPIKVFLRQPAYIALIVIFILIFVFLWFVPDLPPHGSKKRGKK